MQTLYKSADSKESRYAFGGALETLPFRKYLYELAIRDLSNGGRGIGNLVETYLVNPLSNVLVQEEWKAGDVITVQSGPTDGTDRFIYSVTQA